MQQWPYPSSQSTYGSSSPYTPADQAPPPSNNNNWIPAPSYGPLQYGPSSNQPYSPYPNNTTTTTNNNSYNNPTATPPRICPSCHTPATGSENFCLLCGTALPQYCQGCRSFSPSRTCIRCGAQLGVAPPSSSSSSSSSQAPPQAVVRGPEQGAVHAQDAFVRSQSTMIPLQAYGPGYSQANLFAPNNYSSSLSPSPSAASSASSSLVPPFSSSSSMYSPQSSHYSQTLPYPVSSNSFASSAPSSSSSSSMYATMPQSFSHSPSFQGLYSTPQQQQQYQQQQQQQHTQRQPSTYPTYHTQQSQKPYTPYPQGQPGFIPSPAASSSVPSPSFSSSPPPAYTPFDLSATTTTTTTTATTTTTTRVPSFERSQTSGGPVPVLPVLSHNDNNNNNPRGVPAEGESGERVESGGRVGRAENEEEEEEQTAVIVRVEEPLREAGRRGSVSGRRESEDFLNVGNNNRRGSTSSQRRGSEEVNISPSPSPSSSCSYSGGGGSASRRNSQDLNSGSRRNSVSGIDEVGNINSPSLVFHMGDSAKAQEEIDRKTAELTRQLFEATQQLTESKREVETLRRTVSQLPPVVDTGALQLQFVGTLEAIAAEHFTKLPGNSQSDFQQLEPLFRIVYDNFDLDDSGAISESEFEAFMIAHCAFFMYRDILYAQALEKAKIFITQEAKGLVGKVWKSLKVDSLTFPLFWDFMSRAAGLLFRDLSATKAFLQYWEERRLVLGDGGNVVARFLTQEELQLRDKRASEIAKQHKATATRLKVVQEILSTEQSYVELLGAVVDVYVDPLKTMQIISAEEQTVLFGSIPTLYSLNKKLLGDLKARYAKWSDSEVIGDIFVSFAPYFKLYTSYVASHMTATMLLGQLRSKAWVNFCAAAMKDPRLKGEPLTSSLIKPVQRIPRYALLLKELIKHTGADHPDYTLLEKALKLTEDAASHINRSIKLQDNRTAVAKLQGEFQEDPGLLTPSRVFLRHGELVRRADGAEQAYHFFLFNNLLAIASEVPLNSHYKYHLRCKLPLDDSFRVESVGTNVFRIRHSKRAPPAKAFVAGSPCWAMFTDGNYYLAGVVKMLGGGRVVVKYLEYDETREVLVDQLLQFNGDPTNVPAHDSLLKHPRIEHKFEVVCKDVAEKDVWINDIQKQLEENKGKIAVTVSSVSNDSSLEYYEVWGESLQQAAKVQADRSECAVCGDKFSLFRFSYQCHRCHNFVCYMCSRHKVKGERCCDSCIQQGLA